MTELGALGSTAVKWRNTFGSSSLGNNAETWAIYGTCQCDIWPINNHEQIRVSQDIGIGEYFISVPYNEDVTLADVLVINGISYQITFVPLYMTWLSNLRLEAKNYNNLGR